MYLVKILAKKSEIDGMGVFAEERIEKGTIVWKFEPTHDCVLTVAELQSLNQEQKENLKRVAYLSATTGNYVFPPEGDPANFTNHSVDKNNLTVHVDLHTSLEPYFVANRDIEVGEEITNNYHEFDEAIKLQSTKPQWL